MTVDISPLALPRYGEPWTVDDLERLPPDDTMKYEIVDGSLVVSPRADVYHNGIAADLVTKRHYYAVAGIPQYWIADPDEQTLTLLTLDDDGTYAERAVVRPGERWKSDEPFPLTIDPAEIF
jgi:Uma2 family endonuclease